MNRALASFLTICLLWPSMVFAWSSDWVETDEAGIRLHLVETDGGTVAGVLDIRLEPGWKTYWAEPGDGGIPPGLTLTGAPVALMLPVPKRLHAGGAVFAGYDGGARFTFDLGPRTILPPVLDLTAFIGVCAEICIPFEAAFTTQLPDIASGGEAALALAMARIAMPKPDDGTAISSVAADGDTLVVTPADAGATDLFLVNAGGHAFGHVERDGERFRIVWARRGEAATVPFVLAGPAGGISGDIGLPR